MAKEKPTHLNCSLSNCHRGYSTACGLGPTPKDSIVFITHHWSLVSCRRCLRTKAFEAISPVSGKVFLQNEL